MAPWAQKTPLMLVMLPEARQPRELQRDIQAPTFGHDLRLMFIVQPQDLMSVHFKNSWDQIEFCVGSGGNGDGDT